jgi:hypothetical protein
MIERRRREGMGFEGINKKKGIIGPVGAQFY